MTLKELLRRKEVALSLCREVDLYIKGLEQVAMDSKAKNDFVTKYDKYVETFLVSNLSKEFPLDGFLGEEGNYNSESSSGVWVIDPIDGTHNFARGFAPYCISLGFQEEMGNPILGLIWSFGEPTYYWAIKNHGAYHEENKIHVSDIKDPNMALSATAFPMRHKEFYNEYENKFKSIFNEISDIRRCGSAAYDLCMVAKGSLDCYFEYFTGYYDICAGYIIVKEAGGEISSIDRKNFVFGNYCHIIASNKELHNFFINKLVGD